MARTSVRERAGRTEGPGHGRLVLGQICDPSTQCERQHHEATTDIASATPTACRHPPRPAQRVKGRTARWAGGAGVGPAAALTSGADPGADPGYPQGADVGARGPRRTLRARPSFADLGRIDAETRSRDGMMVGMDDLEAVARMARPNSGRWSPRLATAATAASSSRTDPAPAARRSGARPTAPPSVAGPSARLPWLRWLAR